MKIPKHSALLFGMLSAMAVTSANAAFTISNGDLILGFQATGGEGSTKNVFFNLGNPIDYRDGNVANGTLGNINGTLSAVFGANWYSRSDVYFGAAANLNQNANSGPGSRAPIDGDPSRTWYLSIPTSVAAGGLLYAAGTFPNASLGSAGNSLAGMETFLMNGTLTELADGAAILDQTLNPVEWNNSWTQWNPTPGAAFSVFTGGIQQNFGKGGSETLFDLQRVLGTNTGADPTGVVGGGTYVTSFGIGSDGSISVIPEPSAALLSVLGALALLRRRRA
jgi:MYXO-CTERM domain-containing protein